jgi:phosphatidylglycerophosphate synthase
MLQSAAMNTESRRPLKTRSRGWAKKAAALLAGTNISPNQISVASVVIAAIGTAALLIGSNAIGLIICAICIQLRLLCNLLDGMVAIEGGKQSPLGMLYNEFPDRIADSLLIVALGYTIALPWLGWLGALAAMATAYIRVFGGALGLVQDFRGPMAKQHRMAIMTAGCLAGALELVIYKTNYALMIASYVIMLGSLITCMTRTIAISKQLH